MRTSTWMQRSMICVVVALAGLTLSLGMLLAVRTQPGLAASVNSPQAFCDDVSVPPKAECEALVALYNSTNGAGWTNKDGWLVSTTPCDDWFGVECYITGSIRMLDLGGNQLSGSLPASLGNLTLLEEITLNGNQLTGHIPPELGNLSSLKNLSLAINPFTGSIPPELGNLSSLEQLGLSELWYITGTIPAELGQLSNLISLNLCESFLVEGSIPPELGNLEKLEQLSLCTMSLTGTIPPELGNLSQLHVLMLEQNHLTGPIPAEIGNLTNLNQLCLHNNALSGEIPTSITQLTNLNVEDIVAWPCQWDPAEGYTSLDYNKLYSTNPDVTAFLEDKDPGWDDTQTVPPTDLHVAAVDADSLDLAWEPINYSSGGGYYEIFTATLPAGPYTLFGYTVTKTTSMSHFGGLQPGASYYFKLRTFTPAFGGIPGQGNDLWSDFTQPIGFTFDAVLPESGGTLVITDTSSTVTEVVVPPNAVEDTVTLGLTSLETVTTTANLLFASQAFELNAYRDGTLQDDFTFAQPVTVRIEYTDADVEGISEDTMTLLYWDETGGQWVDAAGTCAPPSLYERHPEANWLSVTICHLSQFAMFGAQEHVVYLPVLSR